MFTKSENFKEEYCGQVVKIGELEPIENSDFLVKANIGDGYQVVVGKNDVKEGDVMIYAKLETQLNKDFLSVNNQYELSERQLNQNFQVVQDLIDSGKPDEAKKLVGYFNKHGRVRMVKLRGCPSMGCLFTIDSVAKWKPNVKDYDFSQCFVPNADGIVEPFNFDTIDGEVFIQAFVPKIQVPQARKNRVEKRNRKIKRFDRMVEGQFSFHYDTNMLRENMWRLKPDTMVTISVKLHGTSHIVGNLLVKCPRNSIASKYVTIKAMKKLRGLRKAEKRFYWQRKLNKAKIAKQRDIINSQYTLKYGNVTASRGVIKNQYINSGPQNHFYGKDIWSEYGNLLYPFLIKGMTVYSEICGYANGTNTMIQKNKEGKCFDYGCNPGESFIMPYRITFTDEEGNHTEFDAMEVYGWTLRLLKEHPELEKVVRPLEVVYHGTLGDLYPDVPVSEHWNREVLRRMAKDTEHFGMELDEPLCKSKVPREGIVLRIDNDERAEAFKLKTLRFMDKEEESVDAGIVDIEMQDAYNSQEEI